MSLDDDFQRFISSFAQYFVPSEETTVDAINTIRNSAKKYVESRNLKSLVISLHGDLASSVVAALCQEEYTGVPLLGIVFSSVDQAHQDGQHFCTSYYNPGIGNIIEIDKTSAVLQKYVELGLLNELAQKENGIVLGSNTWTDTYATFAYKGEADYSPIQSINKGFELPEIAKALDVIGDVSDHDRAVDVIINGYMGNFDENLSCQLERYRPMERVERIIMRYELNKLPYVMMDDRITLNLPTNYSF